MFLALVDELLIYQVVVKEVSNAATQLYQHPEASLKGCLVLLCERRVGDRWPVLSKAGVNWACLGVEELLLFDDELEYSLDLSHGLVQLLAPEQELYDRLDADVVFSVVVVAQCPACRLLGARFLLLVWRLFRNCLFGLHQHLRC